MMKRAAYVVGAVVLLMVLVVLLAPAFVDTPAVRAEIQGRLAQALDGQVTWEALKIRILPAPHGELRRVRVEMPGRMSAAADRVAVYLRLWPLLRGRAEVASVDVVRPEVRLAGMQDTERSPEKKDELDAVAAYRKALEPVVKALQQFAPDTVVRIEGAALSVADLRELSIGVRTATGGIELELSAASALWKRLSIKGRVDYASLAARAQVRLDALVLDRDVPPATLRAEVRTDGTSAIECDFDASLGSLAAAKGKLVMPAGRPPHLAAHLGGLDLAQALTLARLKMPGLDAVESAEGRLSADATVSLARDWQAQIAITKSDAAVKLAQLPWKLSAHAAQVTASRDQVQVKGLRGSIGESSFTDVGARIELGKTPRLAAASARTTLKLEQWFPWLQAQFPVEDLAALSGMVEVDLKRLALRFDRPAEADFDAVATLREVRAGLKSLPAPVNVASGSVRVDPARARLEKVAVAMLDARTQVSGSISLKKLALDLALVDGELGEKVVQWALARGGVPARLEPRTPLRFAAQRIAWAPEGALEADARIDFDGGPQVALALAWKPELLELRRLAISDAASDAVLGASVADELVQASFSGRLHGSSIAAMLRRPEAASGVAQGKLRVTVDRAQPRRTFAEGSLRIEALDLTWLAGKRAIVERIDLSSDRTSVRIAEARLDWEQQVVDLRGEIRRTEAGPVIEARLESAGVVLDRVLPSATEKKDPAADADVSRIWPLPVSGRIELKSGFVQYQHHRIAPLAGTLALEPQRARLEVKEARMCGVSFPLKVDADPRELAATASITMKAQPLEDVVRCLTGGTVELTGDADLRAELQTRGKPPDLVRNLAGTVHAETRKGSVKRFALLGNILSLRNIAAVSEVKEGAFPYRSMRAQGRFERGEFVLEEGFFDSDALRLAAYGRVDLLGDGSRLTVLVGLLTGVDRAVGAIPILGSVAGSSMTGLPVGVTGDIRHPVVVPLGPRAVTEHVLGIFERTLKLPGKLAVPPPQ